MSKYVSLEAVQDTLIWYEVNGKLNLKQTMALINELPTIEQPPTGTTAADVLESRLKHLLQSDFIRSFDAINYKTGKYKRDITEADKITGTDPKIFYLCDGEKCKNCSSDICKHTGDMTHAKNFQYDGYANYWEQSATDPDKCQLDNMPEHCPYYPNGCGKCKYNNP